MNHLDPADVARCAAALVERSTREQRLPFHVVDPQILRAVAALTRGFESGGCDSTRQVLASTARRIGAPGPVASNPPVNTPKDGQPLTGGSQSRRLHPFKANDAGDQPAPLECSPH